jgi:hypothetical protein
MVFLQERNFDFRQRGNAVVLVQNKGPALTWRNAILNREMIQAGLKWVNQGIRQAKQRITNSSLRGV